MGKAMAVGIILSVFLALAWGVFSSPTPTGASGGPPDIIPGQYIVVLVTGALPEQVAADHGLARLQTYRAALNGFAAAIPDARLTKVEGDPRVNSVVPDRTIGLFPEPVVKPGANPGAASACTEEIPTGVNRIDAEGVSGTFPGMAIIDTGIDLDHPDLNVAGGVSFVGGTADDGNGHGTHVAGSAAARSGNCGVRGVAPGAPLWAVKVLTNGGTGSWSGVIAGIDWVTANAGSKNIKVANMSLGSSGSDSPNCGVDATGKIVDPLHRSICNSVAAGVTYAVAAGNSNSDANNFVPATYAEVITVSAIADYDGKGDHLASPTCANYGPDDTLASFSNFGADVDLAAPGVCIKSTYKNGGYTTMSGTSMASPHVAGAAALKVAGGAATPAAVKAALLAAAKPVDNSSPYDVCTFSSSTKTTGPMVYVGPGTCN